MGKNPEWSLVQQFFWLSLKGKPRSRSKLCQERAALLGWLVENEFQFELGDVPWLAGAHHDNGGMHWCSWAGNSIGDVTGEGFYCLAVRHGNVSFCRSFERHYGRPAIILGEYRRTWHGDAKLKSRRRVAIGDEIWVVRSETEPFERVCTVTALEHDAIRAVVYHDEPEVGQCETCGGPVYPEGYSIKKIKRRFRFEKADFKNLRVRALR